MIKFILNHYKELFTSPNTSFLKEKTTIKKFGLSLIVAVISCKFAAAQLSVRNSAYVFINDEIVFVEDDINLEEPASTIYLRTDAQVIQGTGTTGNSGEGELSVYQDGNVGAYEYNFWCSPTGSRVDNNLNNPFGITLLNDIDDLTNSIPAETTHQAGYNGDATGLKIEPYWIWKFIEGIDYADWIYVGDATTIEAGEGFTMKGTAGTSANNPGENQKYDFRGKPNTGTIAVPVDAGKQSLVGNPYPSAMDAHAYIYDANNIATIDGTLFYYDQDPDVNSHNLAAYEAGYTTYTINSAADMETIVQATFYTYNTDGTINSTTGDVGTKIPARYVPIGQGFMVMGIASGTVNAQNSHRVYEKENGTTSTFFKSANSKTAPTEAKSIFTTVPTRYKRFRLNINFNNTYTRQIVETFSPSATEGFDRGLESRLPAGDILASDAAWLVNDVPYIAEALAFDETMKIPLNIKVANNMPIQITIADVQNFDSNLPIFIHDKATNIYVNLKTQNFNLNLDTGNYTERFEVTFKEDSTLDIEEHKIDSLDAIQNNTTDVLKVLNPSNLDITSIFVYDVAGKQVLVQKPSTTSTAYTLSTTQLSTGVYVVKATLNNNTTFSKKIIIN
ncbi:T9SS sorting signal type C domain-containing protein [Algibacter sp. Ld11]|uniref:T9SS sorting signal type C domain-containing protein n=1 Tax=Algibacter sp. Ld11 TaxID=649150 RepID=UPI003863A7E8